jgi:LysM repeat protein
MKNYRSCAIVGVLILASLCLLAGGLYTFPIRARALNSRPLVLIHNPLNRDEFKTGEMVSVHATARSQSGLARMELWADDALVAGQNVQNGEQTKSVTFSENWTPLNPGSHTLVVRAVSANGVNGQSSIALTAVEDGTPPTHRVQEGETLETIAAQHGITPEQIGALNPGLGPSGPLPGSSVVVPEGGEPPVESGAPSESGASPESGVPPESGASPESGVPSTGGGEPPAPEAEPPASPSFLNLFFGFFENFNPAPNPGDPTGLRLEVISLRTATSYEGLHCYVGLAGSTPAWYPDFDGNQATDDSFSAYGGAGAGGASWDAGEYLSGEDVPAFFWPENLPIPFEISCVGINGGGTVALELGRLEMSIPPDEWNGIVRRVDATGSQGSFTVGYRVIRLEDAAPKPIEPITMPSNVHIGGIPWQGQALIWEHNPPAGQTPIDGFRIYLNGNLQWVESADSRYSILPNEWLNPPCGTVYTFGVSAYRLGPDGSESNPGEASLGQRLADCTREIQIEFLTLETHDLGGDGDEGDRHGDIGPAYGYFFANEDQITFSGGHLGYGLDLPNGLRHNTTYNLDDMAADPGWRFSGTNSAIVDVPPGGTFEYGFHIMDEDSGRCDDSDDPGCDDLICEGLSMIYDDHLSIFDQVHEESITSDDGRCTLRVRWGPAFGSPVGSGTPGDEPLPWIQVEDITIDATTGTVQIYVRNTGRATWPRRDLEVELQSRDHVSLGVFTWPDFVLEPGQRTVLENRDMRLSAPFDACVMIDPTNDVLEEYERSGAMYHNPVCPPRPDLTITNVQFDSATRRLLVSVRNIGDGPVANRALSLRTYLPNGIPISLEDTDTGVTLAPNETRVFDVPGVNESARNSLANGYVVTVNPNAAIPESNTENNSFSIAPYQLRMWANCSARVPHYHGSGSTARIFTTAEVLNGTVSRTVLELPRSDTLSGTETYLNDRFHYWAGGNMFLNSCINESQTFNILGDESLRVTLHADFLAGSRGDREDLGTATDVFGADRYSEFPIFTTSMLDTFCPRYYVTPDMGMLSTPPWFANFCIGRVAP